MLIEETSLPGVLHLTPRVFGDDRGYFVETYSQSKLAAAGMDATFVQDNESSSQPGVVRGLHYQHPNDQGKLVRVISGAILDVAVDIRHGSPTFGQWLGYELSGTNKQQLWVPPGFAHGFSVLGDESAVIAYKCTAFYAPDCEHTIAWDDPQLGVDWRVKTPILSDKDQSGICLRDLPKSDLPPYG